MHCLDWCHIMTPLLFVCWYFYTASPHVLCGSTTPLEVSHLDPENLQGKDRLPAIIFQTRS